MIDFDMDLQNLVLTVRPGGPMSENDFRRVAQAVDPIIDRKGALPGLIIYAEGFPGWSSFAAMLSHLRFVKGHHKQIKKVAAVSDAAILKLLPHLVDHFVNAQVRHFAYADYDAAKAWVLE